MDGTPTQAGTSEFTVRASSHDWRALTDLGLKVTVAPKKKQEQVTVTVSPATANIPSGASQQLTAVVHGSDNKQIHWSANAGTISTSGLFTAPSVTHGRQCDRHRNERGGVGGQGLFDDFDHSGGLVELNHRNQRSAGCLAGFGLLRRPVRHRRIATLLMEHRGRIASGWRFAR